MQAVIFGTATLLTGFVLDIFLGDPRWLYHPVRIMGALVSRLEGYLRGINPDTPDGRRTAGAQMAVFGVLITFAGYYGLTALLPLLGNALHFLTVSFLCYQLIAARDLYNHGMRVYRMLKKDDISGARRALSMMVGRDTEKLDADGIIRATVETISENATDGVVAPLFYMALGGPALGAAYKMINTMDSMVGYKNERYIDFGWAGARLDDFANLIPARFAALCMMVASVVCAKDVKGAFLIWKRDRKAHPSPNSAQTESVCAGALGIRLGGGGVYGGIAVDKPTIGDELRPVCVEDVSDANTLMLLTSIVALLTLCLLRLTAALIFSIL